MHSFIHPGPMGNSSKIEEFPEAKGSDSSAVRYPLSVPFTLTLEAASVGGLAGLRSLAVSAGRVVGGENALAL
jgi:hypothetical protein